MIEANVSKNGPTQHELFPQLFPQLRQLVHDVLDEPPTYRRSQLLEQGLSIGPPHALCTVSTRDGAVGFLSFRNMAETVGSVPEPCT